MHNDEKKKQCNSQNGRELFDLVDIHKESNPAGIT